MIRFAVLSAVLLLPMMAARADDQDATCLAQEILDKGSSLFDAQDAPALAATYTEDAELGIVSKDKKTGTYKTQITRGRSSIETFYEKIFKDRPRDAKSKNRVEFAHFIGDDLLIIHGHFQLDTSKEGEFPFVQVRTKRGDQWLMMNLQVFVVPQPH